MRASRRIMGAALLATFVAWPPAPEAANPGAAPSGAPPAEPAAPMAIPDLVVPGGGRVRVAVADASARSRAPAPAVQGALEPTGELRSPTAGEAAALASPAAATTASQLANGTVVVTFGDESGSNAVAHRDPGGALQFGCVAAGDVEGAAR